MNAPRDTEGTDPLLRALGALVAALREKLLVVSPALMRAAGIV